MDTPVLFLVYNRPEQTKRVFEAIRKAKPNQLFIAADGPRNLKKNEDYVCGNLRSWLLNNVDWDCELKTRFQDQNMGCGKHVSSAISWFFDNVEKGIILEDDCLPSSDFFMFVPELLTKYENNSDVFMVAGSNFNPTKINSSYYLSSYAHVWGWGTWKTSWDKYHFRMTYLDWNTIFSNLRTRGFDEEQLRLEKIIFDKMVNQEIDTWDYQWFLSIWQEDGFVLTPSKNLVTNIGFEETGTHTLVPVSGVSSRKTQRVGNIKHPNSLVYNPQVDKSLFYKTNLYLIRKIEKHWAKKFLVRLSDSLQYRLLGRKR